MTRTVSEMSWRMAIALLVLVHSGAHAADHDNWTAVSVRGTVVYLVGGHWEEFVRGATVTDGQAVRTLQSGRLRLQNQSAIISLGPNTAVQISDGSQGSSTVVKQYSGSIVVEAGSRQAETIAIETPVLAVIADGGVVSVAFDEGVAEVIVDSGTVAVMDRLNGATAVLGAGQTITNSATAGMDISGGSSPLPASDIGAAAAVGPAAADGAAAVTDDGGTPSAGSEAPDEGAQTADGAAPAGGDGSEGEGDLASGDESVDDGVDAESSGNAGDGGGAASDDSSSADDHGNNGGHGGGAEANGNNGKGKGAGAGD